MTLADGCIPVVLKEMDLLWIWITWIGLVLAVWAGGHAMLRKRSPTSASLWICVSLLLPVLGPLLYLLLGINRTTRRARKRMGRFGPNGDRNRGPSSTDRLSASMQHLAPLVRLGDRIVPEPLVPGNHVEPLVDGENAYAAMLDAIAVARKTITCCTYIFKHDSVGQKFLDAFAAAEQRGVQVKLIIDGFGGWWYASPVRSAIRARQLKLASFAPVGLTPTRLMHFNLRNHRKILVVDGRLGFTGGINIIAAHLAKAMDNPDRCHDMQFSLRGPIVGQIQNAFADDWLFATGEDLHDEAFFPPLEPAGNMLARGIADGPDSAHRKLQWTFVAACQSAQRTLRIMTPFFIPSEAVKTAIIGAALRGVDVLIVVPAMSDVPFSTWATMAYLWEFLEHGIRVAQSGPPFHHTKLTVVDECWTFLGSANIDPRSFRLNFEFNCEVFDDSLGATIANYIDGVAARNEPLTLARVDARSLPVRLRDSFFKLFSPYL